MANRLWVAWLWLVALQGFVLGDDGEVPQPPGPSDYGKFVEPPTSSQRSTSEQVTQLRCQYKTKNDRVVQVTWLREKADGSSEQLMAAHVEQGQQAFGKFAKRMHFESSDPLADSTLTIRTTELSDEGTYKCRITAFPSGIFERMIQLTVWTKPITSLEPVEMVEGQPFHVAATCRSVARPPPRLSWVTELPGKSQNRTSDGGTVSSSYSLHPLRSMNGRPLDCLVWHPTLDKPWRSSNLLVVLYPPDPKIKGYEGSWVVGYEGATLRCDSGGNPKPHIFTWTRNGGALPADVTVEGSTLRFGRPLAATDQGKYECEARNSIGAVKADIEIALEGSERQLSDSNMMPLVAGGIGALVLVLLIAMVIVTCYHRRKNRKLEKELSVKMEEFTTLSRQASIRRFDSITPDPRALLDDTMALPPDAQTRTSMSSLSNPPGKRDSHSTLSMGRAERPIIYSSFRRSERDPYAQNAPNSPDIGPSVSQNPSPVPMGPSPGPGSVTLSSAPPPVKLAYNSVWGGAPTPPEDEEERGEEGEDAGSLQISEAVSHYFHYSNGVLQPKRQPNAILLHHRGQLI